MKSQHNVFLALANCGRELLCFFPAPMVQAQTSSHVSHPGLIQGEQDETAFKNFRRARHRVIGAGLCCDGDARDGGPKRILPPGRHFRNALLQL